MKNLAPAFIAMIFVVIISNYLVQYPLNSWLTWGALTYPISFLVNELTNRAFGPKAARQVVYTGFIIGVLLSIGLSTPRIAFASGMAFLISQLLDISVFVRFRTGAWWHAPFLASLIASAIDTIIFWYIAFLGEPVPLLTLAFGDFLAKLSVDLTMLLPFRMALKVVMSDERQELAAPRTIQRRPNQYQ